MGIGWKVFERFERLLFFQEESLDVFGRIVFARVPFGDALFPIYFRVAVEQIRIPATGEATEMQLEYLEARECRDWKLEWLTDAKWPLPKDPPFPFSGAVTEYVRPIGPGCYVGVAWSAPKWEFNDVGRKLFTFLLVKMPHEDS